MSVRSVPDRTEAAEYYFLYINQVEGTDISRILETQAADTLALLDGITEERSHYRYAPDKWTLRQVLSHINDTERMTHVVTRRAVARAQPVVESGPRQAEHRQQPRDEPCRDS